MLISLLNSSNMVQKGQLYILSLFGDNFSYHSNDKSQINTNILH